MLYLSVEALKILIYLQEDLLKEASKSKFLMSICLRSKDFRVHIQVKQMDSSHRFQIMIVIITAIFFIIIIYLFLVEVEMITVSKKTNTDTVTYHNNTFIADASTSRS